jgi:Gpi18-like mannosyltransferase
LDQFVGWVHHIATEGLTTLYQGTDAGPVTFGPVMAYVWAVLAAIQPAFQSVTDASDPAIRMLMKTPASLADFGLAALVAWALRDRPRWAVLAALAVLLVPAVPYVSAWWGQYESIFVLSGLGAALAAARGRNGLAAVLIAVSLSTKPQAIPLVLPFAAWFWATGFAGGGVRGGALELARTAAIGLAALAVLWLPFIPNGGPAGYLSNLATYQGDIFNVLSLRAWNAWWLLQEAAAGGNFIADDVAFLGPLTLRHVGFLVTGLCSLVIVWRIVEDPRPRTLWLGLAASVLAFFSFMTQMHERYAYAALILLVLLLPERRIGWLWVALGVVLSLNLVAAIPPTPEIGALLPVDGLLGVVGSVGMLGITLAVVLAMRDPERPSPPASSPSSR